MSNYRSRDEQQRRDEEFARATMEKFLREEDRERPGNRVFTQAKTPEEFEQMKRDADALEAQNGFADQGFTTKMPFLVKDEHGNVTVEYLEVRAVRVQ